jgi:hypothetical protein
MTDLNGEIIHIGETQTFASGFQKREFVIKTQEQYSQEILLELFSDKVDLIDAHKIGDTVDVGINLRGKSYTNTQGQKRWFNSLVAWKITKPVTATPQGKVPQGNTQDAFGGENDNDLPW